MTRPESGPSSGGAIAAMVRFFLHSKLTVIMTFAALLLGFAAIQVTPREEEPQIVVPMADIVVRTPGAEAEEVEKLVTTPLERILWQVDGVEYVYSMSRRDSSMVTVRFFVGEDREESLVKLHNAVTKNLDLAPGIASAWVVKPVEIDDVPIVNLTLYPKDPDSGLSDFELRRVAEELAARLSEVEDLSNVSVVSGRSREVRVELSPERMAGLNVSPLEIAEALRGADQSAVAGSVLAGNREIAVSANSFLETAEDVRSLVVGVFDNKPVYLGDVAEIIDGPEEPASHSRIGFSRLYLTRLGRDTEEPSRPAVTIALSKKRGTNAVNVAEAVLERLDKLKVVMPAGVAVEVTRNYGKTAERKVDDLLGSLGFAIVSVVILLAVALGRREALVVALAVPVSFSLALFVNHLLGYTINRVTLFALILSLGLVVDDPITNVDNIQRHILMGKKKPDEATLDAVSEVLPPVIMSTLAIIVSFTPLFFISGMMGPYMAPMAANVPLTVTFSTLCALTIVPWLAYRLLKDLKPAPGGSGDGAESGGGRRAPGRIERFYDRMVSPFLRSAGLRWGLLGVIVAGLAVSLALAAFRLVPLKMLPFDNKNEFQIVIDMDEGAPLERTDRVVREFEEVLKSVPEVVNWVTYAGEPSPMDFNGLVRHYYWRTGGHLADIRVNLADKSERKAQSHAVVLRLRNELEAVARRNGATVKIVESPPGPPVISTVTTEIYGAVDRPYSALIEAARQVEGVMAEEPGVRDIDDSTESDRVLMDFVLDKEKAALHGVSARDVVSALQMALSGTGPGHHPRQGRTRAPAREAHPAPGAALGRGRPVPAQGAGDGRQHRAPGRTGATGGGGSGPAHLPQEFEARGLRVCGNGRARAGRGHPGHAGQTEGRPPATLHLGRMGRGGRMADHPGRVPGPGPGLWRGADWHLHPAGGGDLVLWHAAFDHERHPPDPAGHHAGVLAPQPRGRGHGGLDHGGGLCRSGVLHGHQHDRHDRPGRHRDPQFPGAHRLRPPVPGRGHGPQGGHRAVRSGAPAPHRAHGGHHGPGRMAHHPGPHLLRPGLGTDLRPGRLHPLHPVGGPGGVLCAVSGCVIELKRCFSGNILDIPILGTYILSRECDHNPNHQCVSEVLP